MIACQDYQYGIAGETDTNPPKPTALRNAHRALGRPFRALIGGELGLLHFISHWAVTRRPIAVWARGWPAELWRGC